jgi:hypothetical protein
MRITERQLRLIIRETLISEVGGSEYADTRTMKALSDPAARRGLGYLTQQAGEATIDFGKSLAQLLVETWFYFKTGQQYIDAVRGITGVDVTPENQREWRAQIAAASLHDFLDRFGTAGLDPADIVNGFLYMGEKNWRMAALCMVAAIPVVGGAIVKGRAAGKFAIGAGEVAKVDAGIKDLKKGLKSSRVAGADDVIAEIDAIRTSMNGGKADFKPYEAIPASQKAAAEEVASNPTRLKQAYDDLLERTSADPAKYRAADEINPADYPQGETGIVPEYLSTARAGLGKELLEVWSKYADHNFFRENVKKVHWLGFSSGESRTAVGALEDFLRNAPSSGSSQISTVGYLDDLNPGPRAGGSFVFGPQGSKIQVGIKLRGDTTYATTADAFTTNPSAATRQTGGKFEKIPRTQTTSLGRLVLDNPEMYPDLYAELQKDLAANSNRFTDKWLEPGGILPGRSASTVYSQIMLDRASWREPFTGAAIYNEVVLDNWVPEAVVLNTRSATTEEIGQLKAVADSHGLKLLDTSGSEVMLSDYQRVDRAHVPNRPGIKKGVYDRSAPDTTYDPTTGQIKYTSVKYAEDKIDVPPDREALYEHKRSSDRTLVERWSRLAGIQRL